jgi:phosphohistidine phosphatase
MEIFLVRHAIAVERSADRPDAARPLSERGRARFSRAVRGMARLELRFDRVLHSPWLRAVQTAELLAPITDGDGAREETERLADDPDAALLALAARHPQAARVAFVGHEPWMGELLSLLVLGTAAHGERFPFKKGGVAWLVGEPRPGGTALKAVFTPKALWQMAGDD